MSILHKLGFCLYITFHWRLSFYRGEASLQARGLSLGPAHVEHAVLKLIDVSGPIELDGGIEPFANHRTALERIEE